jgi:hypothetical protein
MKPDFPAKSLYRGINARALRSEGMAMSPRSKTAVAVVVAFSLAFGETVPTVTNTGAVFYWLSFALTVPAIIAGVAWLLQRKHPNRSGAGTALS